MLFQISTDKASVFKIYRFRNLPAKNVPFSCEQEAYPTHFHRFQNVPASCERSLNLFVPPPFSLNRVSQKLFTHLRGCGIRSTWLIFKTDLGEKFFGKIIYL